VSQKTTRKILNEKLSSKAKDKDTPSRSQLIIEDLSGKKHSWPILIIQPKTVLFLMKRKLAAGINIKGQECF